MTDAAIKNLPASVRHAYAGVRLKLLATLGVAQIDLQVDIGFADAITPGPIELDYPTLLEFASPRLRAYPRETVVAVSSDSGKQKHGRVFSPSRIWMPLRCPT